jgi:hypothetical protein
MSLQRVMTPNLVMHQLKRRRLAVFGHAYRFRYTPCREWEITSNPTIPPRRMGTPSDIARLVLF